ncbi:MAG: DMT family protein [Bdellovibrionales bacterium]|nr:DMT family protein [Bdellovibrionales bacterium]
MWQTVVLLGVSNIFMTYAWYGHLRDFKGRALILAILVSWGVAFFEYCFQVPANRIGSEYFTLPQLKVIQEIITMTVFSGFAIFYMGAPLSRNYLYASVCLIAAAYFIFRDGLPPVGG